MAASVDNRLFSHLEPFKSGSSTDNRPGSPVLAGGFPKTTVNGNLKAYYNSSSDDDSEDEDYENECTLAIRKANAGLEPSVLDSRDESTADNWVKRNASMVRLTGKHPFNAEAPLSRLMQHGFITPVPLHYVRNHGPVPKASWDEWTVEVSGLLKRPTLFTMDQLVNDFRSKEFPVTLVCAGNRRKEQNMAKQTIGFNWGAAAVSTTVWRGVPLRSVLKRCGIFSKKQGALHVCFEGSEDLPGGGGSKYGTSITREMAMDPSRDIILAYMQNRERLTPDHGFPVRMLIPGFIGGRMVKWLKRIIVTAKESDNYYHYRDNRVLPSHVDPELATAEGWWYKPEHIINELNINSAITTPRHEEILPINSWTNQIPYTLRGYAYSGGGKKVTRVEVTLNGGETWLVCTLDLPEKPNKYGRYWCWCFWSIEVEVLDLLAAKEIAVRAWDETLNTQPDKLIWNVMGMMNNCWFRVKTSLCQPHKGEVGIMFEHPTQPGNQSGGWMTKERQLEKASAENQAVKKSASSPVINTSSKMFSPSDVEKHNTADSPWIIVHGNVYDCTRFLKEHPGGTDSILINAGTDCTEEFDAIHSEKAKKMLEEYRIGELSTTGNASANSSPTASSKMFSMSEVEQHKSADSPWIIVHGNVYDCTGFLKDHPGGTDSILINAGTDCTEEFDAIHSDKAKKMLEEYKIGELTTTAGNASANSSLNTSSKMLPISDRIGESTATGNASSNSSLNTFSKMFSMSEVEQHKSANSPWIIVHGKVYDCTRFLKYHPGGTDSILINAGTDCTEEFDAVHSDKAKKILEKYLIGGLMTGNVSATSSPNNSVPNPIPSSNLPLPPKRKVALIPWEKIPCKLVEKISLSHDVRLFRFALPNEDQLLGLPVGKHIFLCANIDGKLCMRAYTPSSCVDTIGYFELVVKIYFKNAHPKFPDGGLMTRHLDSMQLGSSIDVKGPLGHIEYTGKGNFLIHGKQKFAKKLAMIAGGSGITPIYQVMQAILKDDEDETEMHVVYANRTEDDILLRDELDEWAEKYPKRVKVWYVVQESVKEGWKFSVGFITENILREHTPEASPYTLALACGPPPMLQFAVNPNLEKMGYDIKESLLVF